MRQLIQDKLVSGENIKTIGGNSILGDGDVPFPIYIPLLFKQNTTITHTGTTSPIPVYVSPVIPAGKFEANDFFNIQMQLDCTNNVNVKTVQWYLNSVGSMAGSPILIGTKAYTLIAGGPFKRSVVFKNSLTSQEVMAPSTSITSDDLTNAALSSIAADGASDMYFICVITLANSGDTVSVKSVRGWVNR